MQIPCMIFPGGLKLYLLFDQVKHAIVPKFESSKRWVEAVWVGGSGPVHL